MIPLPVSGRVLILKRRMNIETIVAISVLNCKKM